MNKLLTFALVSTLALASFAARAAEVSNEERSELRQRAEAFQAERARNPDFQPGEGRLNRQSGDLPPRQAHSRAKHKSGKAVKTGHTETKREKAAKRVRSLKKIPGAFVRK